MSLYIYNTLSRKKEVFTPMKEKQIGMYVCGVTVYDYCHVGHARAAIVFDTFYRYFQHLGYDVHFVRNFTDIDDKIINRANEENVDWQEVNRKYISAFYEDMGQLNIASPTEEPKATDHIPEMLEMIQSLVDQDKAYEVEGDVFYSIKSFKEYGCLSGKNIDELQSGARVEVNDIKRDPLDFALWKKSKPDEPSWDSPWGRGRPGWHIECSAMSKKYLGDTFDIHGGGKDLVFPHHENEIAQSCGCTGKQPVRYWVHNGFVNIDKEKMSKSLGNFFTIREVYKKYHPEVLRLFLISSHYRSPIDFSEKNLDDATKVLSRFYEGLEGARKKVEGLDPASIPDFKEKIRNHELTKKFEAAMNDDLNTAVAMAHMNEELRNLNTSVQGKGDSLEDLAVAVNAWEEAGKILGLFSRTPEEFEKELFEIKNLDRNLDVNKIEQLIADRNTARQSKNWAEADRCRDELTQMGVLIEDTPSGTEWKLK
ncbi:MAG: cysteine--tRNA ligase [Nitrospinae bacterium]|nr:cysteine--tRNA ligase [Nitrospinota bacterium]